MADELALRTALATVQAHGAIGASTSIDEAIAHAEQFVALVPADATIAADLGSGGGLPGLVLAVRCPQLRVTLVERRRTRADLLQRAVMALALGDRVTVLADDVQVLAQRQPHGFDLVTARSFAAPPVTARWAAALLRPGGILLVSEPPDDDPARWSGAVLGAHHLVDLGRELGIRRLQAV